MAGIKFDLGLPSIGDVPGIAMHLVMAALGFDSPQAQMIASVVIGGALIATSAVGLIGTLLLLPLPMVTFAIGVLRLILGGLF